MRSLDQSAIFHVWVREITKYLADTGIVESEQFWKYLILRTLGNCKERFGIVVPTSTTLYRRAPEDLTEAERKAGIISMTELLSEMVAWSAREINLELTSPNEEKVA